jgi:hypothetical protein
MAGTWEIYEVLIEYIRFFPFMKEYFSQAGKQSTCLRL